jgi:polycomb group RING finger protein 3
MRATILHVKKFVAKKLSLNRPEDVDVLCNREVCGLLLFWLFLWLLALLRRPVHIYTTSSKVLGKEYTLEYIFKTRWRKEEQLCLKYRPRIDFEVGLLASRRSWLTVVRFFRRRSLNQLRGIFNLV